MPSWKDISPYRESDSRSKLACVSAAGFARPSLESAELLRFPGIVATTLRLYGSDVLYRDVRRAGSVFDHLRADYLKSNSAQGLEQLQPIRLSCPNSVSKTLPKRYDKFMTHNTRSEYCRLLMKEWRYKAAFVIQFHQEADIEAGRFEGRIFQMASHKATRATATRIQRVKGAPGL